MPKEEKKEETNEERVSWLEEKVKTLTEAISGRKPIPAYKKIVNVMFVDDLPVVVFGKVKSAVDDSGQENHVISITTKDESGKTDTKEVEYTSLVRDSIRHAGEVTKEETEYEKKNQGPIPTTVTAKDPDPAKIGGNASFQPRRVLLEETVRRDMVTLRFLSGPWEGKELTMDALYLNP